jgi:hypothetical protein
VTRKRPKAQRNLLERILDTPHLAHVVPRLSPDILHRVIQTCGLEDCVDLVAMATPGQLARVLDLDVWRAARPGLDEELDAGRFGVWLAVLMESGASVAAQKLAGLDGDLVIAALAQHVAVFDCAAVSPSSTDGEELPEPRRVSQSAAYEIGNYLLEAKRTDAWDAIIELLVHLDADDPDFFHRLMRGCRNRSNSGYEIDGLHDLLSAGEQTFDLTVDRERRRETQGFVTPAQARAFLQSARQLPFGDSAPPPLNPIARAYFQAIEWTPPPEGTSDGVAAVVDALLEAGVLPQAPRALLGGSHEPARRVSLLERHLQFARDAGETVYSSRSDEFGYLANALLAGCSIQARPFTPQEASDAATAVCNLGLEHWPAAWRGGTALPDDLLVRHDLIAVFQVGWTVLHDDVCMYAAGRLIDVLGDLRSPDPETQRGLDDLGLQMTKHWRAGTPWRAREAMDVLVTLDMPAWAALLGLIDECPVIHAAMATPQGSRTRAVSATSFEFISGSSQVAAVRDFMESLAETLRA